MNEWISLTIFDLIAFYMSLPLHECFDEEITCIVRWVIAGVKVERMRVQNLLLQRINERFLHWLYYMFFFLKILLSTKTKQKQKQRQKQKKNPKQNKNSKFKVEAASRFLSRWLLVQSKLHLRLHSISVSQTFPEGMRPLRLKGLRHLTETNTSLLLRTTFLEVELVPNEISNRALGQRLNALAEELVQVLVQKEGKNATWLDSRELHQASVSPSEKCLPRCAGDMIQKFRRQLFKNLAAELKRFSFASQLREEE